ncbi:MAG: hypothetical protein WHS63_06725 [Tenuifilum sp.]
MHAILFPKSRGKALHRNRKAWQRAVYKKATRIKGKEMLRLAQHDKIAERKIGFLSSRAKARDLFKGLKRKEQ